MAQAKTILVTVKKADGTTVHFELTRKEHPPGEVLRGGERFQIFAESYGGQASKDKLAPDVGTTEEGLKEFRRELARILKK